MVTKLLGVAHEEKYAKKTLNQLKEVKSGQVVGLECPKVMLDQIEQLYEKQVPKEQVEKELNKKWRFGMYFYKIFKHVKAKGGTCIPIAPNARTKAFYVNYLLIQAARERLIVKNIIRTKPDYVVVGVGHVNEVQRLLEKKGYKSKVVFRQMTLFGPAAKLVAAFSRSAYRKIKADKARARQKKKTTKKRP